MTANLPTRPDPTPARVIPFPLPAPRRDIAEDLYRHAELLEAIADFFQQIQQLLPDPIPCPACNTDMAQWTPTQRAQHWHTHGPLARAVATIRGWTR